MRLNSPPNRLTPRNCGFESRPGRPYALIQPITEAEVDDLLWSDLVRNHVSRAWDDDDDALYDYL
jgi:hypothetical protein